MTSASPWRSGAELVVEGDPAQRVTLGEEIGHGTFGTVFRVVKHPDLAAKVYSEPWPALPKVIDLCEERGLVEPGPPGVVVAAPRWALSDAPDGPPVGYLMALVPPAASTVLSKSLRAGIGRQPLAERLDLAARIADAVAWVHLGSCVIGDLNPGNLLALDGGAVAVIDVDSFTFLKRREVVIGNRVTTQNYRAPEIRRNDVPTPESDVFALAVTVTYVLLAKHPYHFAPKDPGTGGGELQSKIQAGQCWVLEPESHQTPAGEPGLLRFPPPLRDLVRSALGPGPRGRAKAWADVLGSMTVSACRVGHPMFEGGTCGDCSLHRAELRAARRTLVTPPPRSTPTPPPAPPPTPVHPTPPPRSTPATPSKPSSATDPWTIDDTLATIVGVVVLVAVLGALIAGIVALLRWIF
jgi:DNA-binding helix-hairpin-helix protein with protein kinase domain